MYFVEGKTDKTKNGIAFPIDHKKRLKNSNYFSKLKLDPG